ncbi:hypothetical protein V2J09_001557 [Rumex salicifolius]
MELDVPLNSVSGSFVAFLINKVKQALLRSTGNSRQRLKLAAMVESGVHRTEIEACAPELVDSIPCDDPKRNIRLSREMNFYRERHCPFPAEMPLCLIPPPQGYKISIPWPDSLSKIWHENMAYNRIGGKRGEQGWMKQQGPYFIFPGGNGGGGGTILPDGAHYYIQKLGQYIPLSSHLLRTALDMGCGIASFGGYLLLQDILTLSFAPRDSHKAQIQFALERGVPAFVAMLGSRRLPFPAFSFDLVHCSRCLISFTDYNGTYFAEVDRLLRPEGYFVISGPPVQWPKHDKEWADLKSVARALCYELIAVDGNTVIWKKPKGDFCLPNLNEYGLEFCDESEDPSYAWYYKLRKCVTKTTSVKGDVTLNSIPRWPSRLYTTPNRMIQMNNGLHLFEDDAKRWINRVAYYKNFLNVKLGSPTIRNVMDMNALYGGFAASIVSDPVWVMNVVPLRHPLTLDVIYDRGLIGVYHDWCEPFSTYPRTYDLLHVVGIDSLIKDQVSGKNRCNLVDVMVEMDRILRPEGTVIVRDTPEVIDKVNNIAHAIRWTTAIHEKECESHGRDRILLAKKTFWKSSTSKTLYLP